MPRSKLQTVLSKPDQAGPTSGEQANPLKAPETGTTRPDEPAPKPGADEGAPRPGRKGPGRTRGSERVSGVEPPEIEYEMTSHARQDEHQEETAAGTATPEGEPEAEPAETEGLSDAVARLLKKAAGIEDEDQRKTEQKAEGTEAEKTKEPGEPEPGKEAEPPERRIARRRKLATEAGRSEEEKPDSSGLAAKMTEAAAAAAEAAKKASEALEKVATKQAESPPLPELDERSRHVHAVLEVMADLWPERYAGKPAAFLRASNEIAAYRARWQAENPGKKFDPRAAEHDQFFAGLSEADWDEEDFKRAEAVLLAERRIENKTKGLKDKLTAVERKLAETELMPVVARVQAQVIREIGSVLGQDYGKIVGPDGTVAEDVLQKVQETDPLGTSILLEQAARTAQVIEQAARLYHGLDAFDPKNPIHREVRQFIQETEKAIASAPESEKLDNRGRLFATWQEYAKLGADEREKRWTIGYHEFVRIWTEETKDAIKSRLEQEVKKFDAVARRLGYKPPERVQPDQEAPGSKQAQEQAAQAPSQPRKPPEGGTGQNLGRPAASKPSAPASPLDYLRAAYGLDKI